MQATKGSTSSQKRFTCGRLGLRDLGSWPLLKTKAAPAFDVQDWLASKLAPENSVRSCLFGGLSTLCQILRKGPTWLNQEQKALMRKSRDAFLFSYQAVAKDAARANRP
eukprot:6487300-Alexandrium_andersonii.AAC.1